MPNNKNNSALVRVLSTAVLAGGLFLTSASILSAAPAASEGQMCGGIAGIACADGLWCDPEPGKCGGADIAGTCVKSSPVCTRDYRPVCGCDGITYGNECTRRAEKVAKDYDGECGKKR